ncbi:MAG TPA: phosphate-starvation-inducible PsiE family protein [Nitrospiria bacterium]
MTQASRHSNDDRHQLRILEWLEKYGYVTAGLSFLILGMIVFVDGWLTFFGAFAENLPHAVLGLMDQLLLVVILLELFRTIINFLKRRIISLEPFLHVGIIASIRRLLSIGAEMTIAETIPAEQFSQFMVDAGVHGGLIVVMVLALYLYRPQAEAVSGKQA